MKYEHLILPDEVRESQVYTTWKNARGKSSYPQKDTARQGQFLREQFARAWEQQRDLQGNLGVVAVPARKGTYLEFSSDLGYDLKVDSLEDTRSGIRLLNYREECENNAIRQFATVYIPEGKEAKFSQKLDAYINEQTETGKPKNNDLFRSIANVRLALLRSLWTDKSEEFPTNDSDWYEVWIKVDVNRETEQCEEFNDLLNGLDIRHKKSYLVFPERAVFLVYANDRILSDLLNKSDCLAEIKKGRETSGFWFNESRDEQNEWIEDLLHRLVISQNSNVTVCLFDTGLNNKHPLLASLVPDENCLSNVDDNTTFDNEGHGTGMAGLIEYGDLCASLETRDAVTVSHKLCSVKILPDSVANPKEIWGKVTEESVYRAEISFPDERKVYCMAITAERSEKGLPTSWSGAIDKLSFNDGAHTRLFLISAGNIRYDSANFPIWDNYPQGIGLRQIENPSQAWNALTIGAYTEKVAPMDPSADVRLAPSGGISPFSTTSSLWESAAPIKPEVMFEGGNLFKTQDLDFPYTNGEQLELLTTSNRYRYPNKPLTTVSGTSPATALAANMASSLMQKYPGLWPESIRALIVHSARWSQAMERQFPVFNRNQMESRLRYCGYGVPSLERALFSTDSSLTCISQAQIQPYIKQRGVSAIKTNEMHIYDIPWPKDILAQLGEVKVTLRITLSYFIEPGPGEIGWKNKYRYSSCGLRFDVNTPNESAQEFSARISKAMYDEENGERGVNDSSRWTIGTDNHSHGSIHTDSITDTAANIATTNMISVYPVIGWWKLRTNLGKVNSKLRYSLIVSLETPNEDIDIYNVVKTKIGTLVAQPVEVEIPGSL